nr:hypothetical protein [Klebsiella pneumoniae subsp. pneumoniae]
MPTMAILMILSFLWADAALMTLRLSELVLILVENYRTGEGTRNLKQISMLINLPIVVKGV